VLEVDPLEEHVDVHNDDVVERFIPVLREEESIPRITTTSGSSPSEHEAVQDLSVELCFSPRENPHNDIQSSSPLPIVQSIPVEAELLAEMERLDQASSQNYNAQVTNLTQNEGGISVEKEQPHIDPKIQDSLDLWRRIRDYDNENAANPYTPVLSRKQKQQVKKQVLISKPSYTTRSQGAPPKSDQ